MAQGRLRIYLGAAPGVGKTFAMLDEARRRRGRGTDVVIGLVETHGRERVGEMLDELDAVPPLRGAGGDRLDVDGLRRRRPEVVLVDDLAGYSADASGQRARWEDVEELCRAGIDVIATVDIQHLESLADVVERIVGHPEEATVPDTVLERADQVELVDMTPEALRRRVAHGNVCPPEEIPTALAGPFEARRLTALRELALRWVADHVDEELLEHLSVEDRSWETRERIAVAMTGAPGGDVLIRRAARLAARSHTPLMGIHVQGPGADRSGTSSALLEHRRLLEELGGQYHDVVATDTAAALVETALGRQATQLVVGASRRSRWSTIAKGSLIDGLARASAGRLDLHVIDTAPASQPARRATTLRRTPVSRLPAWRQLLGLGLAAVGLPLITVLFVHLRDSLGFASIGFFYLLAVVVIGAIGGAWASAAAALIGFVLLNWYFADPLHTLTLADERESLALFAFLVVAAVVGALVERAARRSSDALRARREAEALASMSGLVLREDDPLDGLVEVLRSTFGLDGVSVLRAGPEGWELEASAGEDPPRAPAGGLVSFRLADDVRLVAAGPNLTGPDLQVLEAYSTQLALALESRRLRDQAARAEAQARVNDLRDSVLAALSHDLRTPLATIKASASSLLDGDEDFDPATRHQLLEGIDEEADRLNTMVGNLLDLGRLQAGALRIEPEATELDEVVTAALGSVAPEREVSVKLPTGLPSVVTDPVLLERALANLVGNAVRYSPSDAPVVVSAAGAGDRVEIRVVDHGPGIPRRERQRVFQPFERLDDTPEAAGVGLGLAVARGFIDATGATLEIDDTPGGGTTMIVSLPRARP